MFITLTLGHRNELIDCRKAQSRNCSSTNYGSDNPVGFNNGVAWVSLLIRRIHLRVPQESNDTDYGTLSTTQDEWTLIDYAMQVLRPFRYWTLQMSKRDTDTWHHIVSILNDMFDHMDGIMPALAEMFLPQKLSKYYAEVSPTMVMLLILAYILDPFQKLPLFEKWDQGMDINPDDEMSHIAKYQAAFLMYVENKFLAIHGWVSIMKPDNILCNNLFSSAMASGSGQYSVDECDLSSDDEENLTPRHIAEMIPVRSDCTAHIMTAAMLYSSAPPESPENWGQINPNFNDFHPDPKESSSTHRIPDTTDRRHQPDERTRSMRISPMWHVTYSLSCNMVSQWRPPFAAREMFSAGAR